MWMPSASMRLSRPARKPCCATRGWSRRSPRVLRTATFRSRWAFPRRALACTAAKANTPGEEWIDPSSIAVGMRAFASVLLNWLSLLREMQISIKQDQPFGKAGRIRSHGRKRRLLLFILPDRCSGRSAWAWCCTGRRHRHKRGSACLPPRWSWSCSRS